MRKPPAVIRRRLAIAHQVQLHQRKLLPQPVRGHTSQHISVRILHVVANNGMHAVANMPAARAHAPLQVPQTAVQTHVPRPRGCPRHSAFAQYARNLIMQLTHHVACMQCALATNILPQPRQRRATERRAPLLYRRPRHRVQRQVQTSNLGVFEIQFTFSVVIF
jgi:hypothetical protein